MKNAFNRHVTATWTYHNDTKHSWESIRTHPHVLDLFREGAWSPEEK